MKAGGTLGVRLQNPTGILVLKFSAMDDFFNFLVVPAWRLSVVFFMKHHQRKCRCCKNWFTTDPRNHHHQRFCKRAPCRKASKIFSHKQWLAKPRTWKLWGGVAEVERVRAWRKLHPFYWKRTIPLVSPKLNCAT